MKIGVVCTVHNIIHISHAMFGGGSTAFGSVPTALHFTLIVFMAT